MEAKAEPRNEKGQTLAEFLAAYDENKYRRPSVTVDMVVFTLNERGELCVIAYTPPQPSLHRPLGAAGRIR